MSINVYLLGVILIIILIGAVGLYQLLFIKIPQDSVLIINDMGQEPKIHFSGPVYCPLIYKKTVIKIKLISFKIELNNNKNLVFKDNEQANICVIFNLKVNETSEDVLKAVKAMGVKRISNQKAVSAFFDARFIEALRKVAEQTELVNLLQNQVDFLDGIINTIGSDLNGYVLKEVIINHVAPTVIFTQEGENTDEPDAISEMNAMIAANREQLNNRNLNKI